MGARSESSAKLTTPAQADNALARRYPVEGARSGWGVGVVRLMH
jgi:hypothetical protein